MHSSNIKYLARNIPTFSNYKKAICILTDSDVEEQWLSELEDKKLTSVEDLAPPISQQVINTCVKDRQPIPEVCWATLSYLCRIDVWASFYQIKTKSSSKTKRCQETPRQSAAKRPRWEPANAPQPGEVAPNPVQVCSDACFSSYTSLTLTLIM